MIFGDLSLGQKQQENLRVMPAHEKIMAKSEKIEKWIRINNFLRRRVRDQEGQNSWCLFYISMGN